MKNWRSLKVGDTVTYTTNEFDGSFQCQAVITEVAEDHALARQGDMQLWIDDDTAYMFS